MVPATQAEEILGLWFARHALAIDPTYEPAQVLLLSLMVDKTAGHRRPGQAALGDGAGTARDADHGQPRSGGGRRSTAP